MAHQLLYWVSNILIYAMQAASLCCILNRRWSWRVTIGGLAAVFLLYAVSSQLMPRADIERILLGLLVYTLIALLFFRDQWYKSLFCSVMTLVIMAAAADPAASCLCAVPAAERLSAVVIHAADEPL